MWNKDTVVSSFMLVNQVKFDALWRGSIDGICVDGGIPLSMTPPSKKGVLKRHGEHEPHTLNMKVNGRCTTYT